MYVNSKIPPLSRKVGVKSQKHFQIRCDLVMPNKRNYYISERLVERLQSSTPAHSPPDVAAFGERGRLDDFRGHPGVSASSAHLRGLVPLSGQAKVGDLQSQTLHTFILYGLSQED